MDLIHESITNDVSGDATERFARVTQILPPLVRDLIDDADEPLQGLFAQWMNRLLVEWDAAGDCGDASTLMELAFIRLVARERARGSVAWHSLSLQIEAALGHRLGHQMADGWWPWVQRCWAEPELRREPKKPRITSCSVCGSLTLSIDDERSVICDRRTCRALIQT